MKNFICGNVRTKNIIYNKEKLWIPSNVKDSDKVIYKEKFGITKKIHGYSGILIPEKRLILFTYHTSKPTAYIKNEMYNNIKIDELLSPIEWVNPPQLMKYEDFDKICEISEANAMLINPRYGKHKPEDMLWFCYRAMGKCLSSAEKPIIVGLDNKPINVFISSEDTILTPSQATFHKFEGNFELNESIVKQIYDDIDKYDIDKEGKLNFLEEVKQRSTEFALEFI